MNNLCTQQPLNKGHPYIPTCCSPRVAVIGGFHCIASIKPDVGCSTSLNYQHTWYNIQPFLFPPFKDLGPPLEVPLTRLNEAFFEAGLSLPHCLLHWGVWGRPPVVSRDSWSGHERAAWVERQFVFIQLAQLEFLWLDLAY